MADTVPDNHLPLAGETPEWVSWHRKDLFCDLNGNGIADQQIVLHGRHVSVYDGLQEVLNTSDDWAVSDVLVGDLNTDGRNELILLLWKHGSYGSIKPFWLADEDDNELSQHIFVYCWHNGAPYPIWMTSALGIEVADISVIAECYVELIDTNGRRTVWEWISWGLTLVDDDEVLEEIGRQVPALAQATLVAVGDNIAHTSVCAAAYDREHRIFDFASVYEQVAPYIAAADLAAVTQETVLVNDYAQVSSYPEFATPVSMADALAGTGFDVVLSATNHVNDKRPAAIEETLSYWTDTWPAVHVLGIHPDEASWQKIDYIEVNGICLALFDYTYGLNDHALPADEPWHVNVLTEEEKLLADLAVTADEADLVVCFLHIGTEYQRAPSEEQAALIERLIDAGAAAVICSHSHVLGPYGRVRTAAGHEGIVFYGLGNFMSGQTDDIETVLGGAARLTMGKTIDTDGATNTCISSFELVPLVCHTDSAGAPTVYLLDDYIDELAAGHVLSLSGEPFTVEQLRALVPTPLA